ncbi:hypothetical protein HOP50_11g63610 [Chloropicon primus]|uniref:Uncharacterized protein n=1 Tax=Chloropicon primus TaxID=1764295 RepID=A0A5B8MTV6_9CHLO|nr:hypothetical protein A3770_11p63390 [Chloropicon primus]UPR03034.1 hypothetical protein HOP50_11g63610 [Chloropicon primus]|eukprot:QDZ23821.1 hypothetical protein A3770_11p63390 [Chloropicon primus]
MSLRVAAPYVRGASTPVGVAGGMCRHSGTTRGSGGLRSRIPRACGGRVPSRRSFATNVDPSSSSSSSSLVGCSGERTSVVPRAKRASEARSASRDRGVPATSGLTLDPLRGGSLGLAMAAGTLGYFSGAPSCLAAAVPAELYELSALDASSASFVASLLKPALGVASLFMIVRIVLTWFPETKSKEFPWIIFYYTTEPVLSFTRNIFQPVGGVDISPIIWVAFLSFMNEILVGPQGILILLSAK